MAEPTEIKDLMQKVLPGLKPKGGKALQRLQEAWKNVAGEKIARHSRIKQVKRGVVYVEVDSAPLMQYISEMDKEHFLIKLSEMVEGVHMKEIRTRLSKGE